MANVKIINGYPYIEYNKTTYDIIDMERRAKAFYDWYQQRRSIRNFSPKTVPKGVIENLIRSASTAPSGAHKQPWTFCVVSNAELKKKIREAAEEEEKTSYSGRMNETWLQDLAPLGTDWQKPFLEIAPYLIIVFKRSYEYHADGAKHQNYYVQESVGLACGFLLSAIHQAGLAALTHTPSPMNFLSKLLKRPENEKPFLLIPVGYPADECWVPAINRKDFEAVSAWYE